MRSGLLVVLGVALPAAAFALQLSPGAIAAGLAIASLIIASGLAGTAPSGRGTVSVRAQAAYDQGLVAGLLATAVIFGVAGDSAALAVFGSAAAIVFLIRLVTRYTAAPRPASQSFL
jgi:hypothetical protein